MAESEEATKTYRGNCHCGSYVFEVQVPEIKSAMVCNCSICTKKSYMWLYPPKESFTVVKDDGILSEYKFGSFGIAHKVFLSQLPTLCGSEWVITDQFPVLQQVRYAGPRHHGRHHCTQCKARYLAHIYPFKKVPTTLN